MRITRPLLGLTWLVFLTGTLLLTSCASRTGHGISKVNPYHLSPTFRPATTEAMIDFEYRRKLRGAVNASDRDDRWGNYFTVYWSVEDKSQPVTVQLYYRQAHGGPQIFLQEKEIENVGLKNSTEFEIIGEDYSEGGAVTQWKASISQNGSVVDEFKSYLWQE